MYLGLETPSKCKANAKVADPVMSLTFSADIGINATQVLAVVANHINGCATLLSSNTTAMTVSMKYAFPSQVQVSARARSYLLASWQPPVSFRAAPPALWRPSTHVSRCCA